VSKSHSLAGDNCVISETDFANIMHKFGPFSSAPRVAVGVSGGADSMTLAMLTNRWAVKRGGQAIGLTVDHSLRPDSKKEAMQVKSWLSEIKMPHRILCWNEANKSNSGIQKSAREARLRLMCEWCRKQGYINLLLAHHQDDQAETFMLRLAAGSGVDGLASMPRSRLTGLSEGGRIRLLRPFLHLPAINLKNTLNSLGYSWVEDPSNNDSRFTRVRLRNSSEILGREGLTAGRIALVANRMGRDRSALHAQVACFLADNAVLAASGFVTLSGMPWREVSDSVLTRAIYRIISTVSGSVLPPKLRSIERLVKNMRESKFDGRPTLGGCQFIQKEKINSFLVVREAGRIKDEIDISPGDTVRWDGRFTVSLASDSKEKGKIRKINQSDIHFLKINKSNADNSKGILTSPHVIRRSLPVLGGVDGSVKIPHLSYEHKGNGLSAFFEPSLPLCETAFEV
tara:strand:+ start:3909 stop:5276 length:1368 start_codon:yes stop_codon:yes gene_type:complete